MEVAGDGVDVGSGEAISAAAPGELEGEFGEAIEGAGDAAGELVEEGGGFGVEELAGGVASGVEAVREVGGGLLGGGERAQVVAEADALIEGRYGLDEGAEVGLADEEDGDEGGPAAVEVGEPTQAVEGVGREVLGFVEEEHDMAASGGFGFEEGADTIEALEVAGGWGGVRGVKPGEQGGDEFFEVKAAVFEGDEAEEGGGEVVLEDGADEGFATADLAGEKGEVQAALVDDVSEAVEGLLMAWGRVKETGVPGGLKGS
jgi:hypothetical protein